MVHNNTLSLFELKALALWIVYFPFLCLLIPIFVSLVIYKTIVNISSRLISIGNLLEPISGLDVSFCVDDIFTKPKGGTSFIWICKGSIDPQLIHDLFHKAIKDENSGYNYDRLTSLYPSFWLGYPFWTKTKQKFRMENHLKVIRLPVQESKDSFEESDKMSNRFKSRNQLNQFLSSWMQQGFKKGLPLWEVLVIPQAYLNQNDIQNQKIFVIGLKIHHIIGDGYSKLKLLEKIIDNLDDKGNNKGKEKRENNVREKINSTSGQLGGVREKWIEEPVLVDSVNKNINTNSESHIHRMNKNKSRINFRFNKNSILNILLTPITIWKLMKDFAFHKDCFTDHKSSSEVLMSTTALEMDKLKIIRKKFKTGFSKDIPLIVIGASVFAGALRRFLQAELQIRKSHEKEGREGPEDVLDHDYLSKNHSSMNIRELPDHANFVMALPLGTNHPGDFCFCNHWTHGIFNVEIKEPISVKRMLRLDENFKNTLSKKWPQVYSYSIVSLQSLLPRGVWNKITDFNMGASIGSTNMIGPASKVYVGGNEVLEKYAYVGLLWKHSSMTCAFFSYNGILSATLVANKNVINNHQTAERIMQDYMHKEMDELLAFNYEEHYEM